MTGAIIEDGTTYLDEDYPTLYVICCMLYVLDNSRLSRKREGTAGKGDKTQKYPVFSNALCTQGHSSPCTFLDIIKALDKCNPKKSKALIL
ncbi:MAG: hypothetical protein WA364_20570 [Candidatus Nitrosopolaris sp.]